MKSIIVGNLVTMNNPPNLFIEVIILEILLAIISAISSVTVAVVGGIFLIKQEKVKADNEVETARVNLRAEQRRRESLLSMRMMEANTELTICMAQNQLSGQDIKICDVERALRKAQEAKEAYDEYLQEIGKERTL